MSEIKIFDVPTCPFCGKKILGLQEFRDALSVREFQISGMCQDCQDDFFD